MSHLPLIAVLLFLGQQAWAKTFHAASTDFPILTMPPKNGSGEGILVDLTRAALRNMGHELVYASFPWKRALHKALEGEAEILLGVYKTSEREKVYRFNRLPPYQDTIAVFMHAGSSLKWRGQIDKASCPTLGVMLGWSYGDKLDFALSQRTVDNQVDESKALFLVARQRMDCFLVSMDVAEHALDRMDDRRLVQQMMPPVAVLDVYIAFSRKLVDQKFVDKFDQELRVLAKSGVVAEIFKKYDRVPYAGMDIFR